MTEMTLVGTMLLLVKILIVVMKKCVNDVDIGSYNRYYDIDANMTINDDVFCLQKPCLLILTLMLIILL